MSAAAVTKGELINGLQNKRRMAVVVVVRLAVLGVTLVGLAVVGTINGCVLRIVKV